MLRVHRNSIRVLIPLFIGSLILSGISYYFSRSQSDWLNYCANVCIGIMGSSLLSLILAILGYLRERADFFQRYFYKVRDIVFEIAKYKPCSPDNFLVAQQNVNILRTSVGRYTRELGDLYSEAAFILEKYDYHRRKQYLFSLYQYFRDIQSLTRNNWRHLERGGCPSRVLSYTDDVILDYKKGYVVNRVVEDFDAEFDTLLKLLNGTLSRKEKLSFTKTPLTEKVFHILPKEDEEMILLLNQRVKFSGDRKIDAPGISVEKAHELLSKGLITTIKEDIDDDIDQVVGVEISDKAYYYFGYKERYLKANA